jgi:hypothetical protein
MMMPPSDTINPQAVAEDSGSPNMIQAQTVAQDMWPSVPAVTTR